MVKPFGKRFQFTFRNLSLLSALMLLGVWLLAEPASGVTPTKLLPSIVLVHGAFADGSSWDRVVPLLQAKGYSVVSLHEPLTSLAEDVAAARRAIEQQPGDVVLVGHSYGGAVITEAGNDPKVKSLVYVAAFGPDTNESINDLGRGKPPPPWASSLRADKGGFGWLPVETVVSTFAQDLPEAEARLLAVKQGPINTKNFDEKIKVAAWKSRPAWYLRASQDRMIDPDAQTVMAQRMKAKLASVSASHVPMLSRPKDVAAVILSAAAAIRSK
jgi:pimeloyl-ACP methyl ester carboxylesterase